MCRVRVYYTPKHASWLNMAEIEIGALARQYLNCRLPEAGVLGHELAPWQRERNA